MQSKILAYKQASGHSAPHRMRVLVCLVALALAVGLFPLGSLGASADGANSLAVTKTVENPSGVYDPYASYRFRLELTAPVPPIPLPQVVTGMAAAATQTTAVIQANSYANFASTPDSAGVEYGLNADLSGAAKANASLVQTPFDVSLSGLLPGTTYYFRAFATLNGATTYGQTKSFTTPAIPPAPVVVTGTAVDVSYNAATIADNSYANFAATPDSAGVEYGQNADLSGAAKANASLVQTPFDVSLSGLLPSTTYYFRAYATLNGATTYGQTKSFTTPAIPPAPAVVTGTAVDVSYNAATIADNSYANFAATPEAVGVEYGQNADLSGAAKADASVVHTPFDVSLSGLSPSTTYYFRAFATLNGTTTYGQTKSFTTPAMPPAPAVVTGIAVDVSYNAATIADNSYANFAATPEAAGVQYNTNPDMSGATTIYSSTVQTPFDVPLYGLSGGTTYFFRAFATLNSVTVYGELKSFTTPEFLPATVFTGNAAGITTTSATIENNSYANIPIDAISQMGVQYGTSNDMSSALISPSAGWGSPFSVPLSGLSANTTYYYRAFVIANGETIFGEIKQFTTVSSAIVAGGLPATDDTPAKQDADGTPVEADASAAPDSANSLPDNGASDTGDGLVPPDTIQPLSTLDRAPLSIVMTVQPALLPAGDAAYQPTDMPAAEFARLQAQFPSLQQLSTGVYTFNLKKGESLVVNGLADDMRFAVTELGGTSADGEKVALADVTGRCSVTLNGQAAVYPTASGDFAATAAAGANFIYAFPAVTPMPTPAPVPAPTPAPSSSSLPAPRPTPSMSVPAASHSTTTSPAASSSDAAESHTEPLIPPKEANPALTTAEQRAEAIQQAREEGIPVFGIGPIEIPLVAPAGVDAWALLNLMCALAGVLVAL